MPPEKAGIWCYPYPLSFDERNLNDLPKEKKEVQIELSFDSFAFYSPSLGAWHIENGDFDIMVGASSRDIRLTERMKINLSRDKQYTVAN